MARRPELWLVMPFLPPEQLIPVAKLAEELGFIGVAIADHASNPEVIDTPYPYGERRGRGQILPSPFVMIAALAASTNTLRFTTWILVVPLRHPILLAKEIATAARIAGGRLDVGIGSGWMREEFTALGVDSSTRARRMDESISLMRRFWTGEFVSSDTDLFRFAPNQILPSLHEPPVILVGGHSDKALERAARTSGGWVGAFMGYSELTTTIADLNRRRESHGRAGEPFEIRVSFESLVTDNDLERLGGLGVTGVLVAPWQLTDSPLELEAVLDGMRRFC